MLIALHHMCDSELLKSPELRDWLSAKVAGVGIGGKETVLDGPREA